MTNDRAQMIGGALLVAKHLDLVCHLDSDI